MCVRTGNILFPKYYFGNCSSWPHSVPVVFQPPTVSPDLHVDFTDHQMRLCRFSVFQLNAANPWGTTSPQYKSQRRKTIHNIIKELL